MISFFLRLLSSVLISEGLPQFFCVRPTATLHEGHCRQNRLTPHCPLAAREGYSKLSAAALYLACVTLGWCHCLQAKSKFGNFFFLEFDESISVDFYFSWVMGIYSFTSRVLMTVFVLQRYFVPEFAPFFCPAFFFFSFFYDLTCGTNAKQQDRCLWV